MIKMKDLTFILPIYDNVEDISLALETTVSNFSNARKGHDVKLLVVSNKDVISSIKSMDYEDIDEYVEVPEGFVVKESSLINYAVGKIKTKYFSVISLDDAINDIWLKNVDKYINYDVDASILLPLVECYKTDKNGTGELIGYSNEAVWATSFSEEVGYFDEQSLLDYMYFTPYCGIIDVEDYKEVGQLKESMEYLYWCELFLRFVHNKKRIFTIPKVGYRCSVEHEGSKLKKYTLVANEDEMNFWIDTVKKEYLFKKDRNKTYKGQ